MKFLLALVILTGIAVLGSKISFLRKEFSLGVKNIFFTGIEYILIGLILGESGIKILDIETLPKFYPFLVFGLAWIGYLFGVQFEFQQVKKLPRMFFSITAIQAFVTFLSVSIIMFIVFRNFFFMKFQISLILSIFLGTIALSTAQSAIAIVNKNYKFKNQKLFDLLRYVSGVDGVFAIMVFAVLLAFMKNGNSLSLNPALTLLWLSISVLIGFIPAVIFRIMNRVRPGIQEFPVFLVGVIIFTGGLAIQLNHSPLVCGFFGGIIIANSCRYRTRVLLFLHEAEKAIYIIMLLILGAGWNPDKGINFILVLFYIVFRLLGKFFGNFIAARSFRSTFKIPSTIGIALLSEGGLSFGILINFIILFPELSDKIIYIVILSSFINELLSPRLILTQFKEKEFIGNIGGKKL
ncbi:MAG: cation:proton antiporter [Acidobacteriota bacterium]